jgi:alkanesulfonate monooxygenase SsuD/methylene tetrahydromethanopterin reductase-like flavin-dependent oxidoreductase (luciferase family)
LVRTLARRLLTGYAVVPTYTATLARQGYGQSVAPVLDAWRAGDRALAASLLPEEIVDDFFVHGTPDECRARLETYREAGVRTAILMHVAVAVSPEERASRIAAQLEALAHDQFLPYVTDSPRDR